MINFIENKNVNWQRVNELLEQSRNLNQWTNFGPVSILTEKVLKNILKIPKHRSIVLCSSGTAALFGLVNLRCYIEDKPLRWVVSSFGFYCTHQGPLSGATIVDCDAHGLLDLSGVNPKQCDGLVITNPFGVANTLDKYKEFCNHYKKILICDSASAFDAVQTHDVDEAISLHHTKPWGFGEGGCAIVEQKYDAIFRDIINFGITIPQAQSLSTNGKISDISAAFILQRLENIKIIKKNSQNQYARIKRVAKKLGIKCLINREINHCPHCVPLIWDKKVDQLDNPYVKLHKYYKPLLKTKIATNLYERIINFPCHSELFVLEDAVLEQCLRGEII